MARDLAITWPKTRPLQSYLDELARALEAGQHINFRVPSLPKETCEFCFAVHGGALRGFCRVVRYAELGEGQVRDPVGGGFWPAGFYVVRMPYWHPLDEPVPMKGFQGYRYIGRPAEVAAYA